MEVTPSKRDLERIVQIRESLVGAQQQPAPDHRAEAAQPSMKLINLESGHNPGRLSKYGTDHQPPVCLSLFAVLPRRWVVEISQAECPYSVCHRSSYHWQRRFATTVEPSTAFAADRRTFTSGRWVMPAPSRLCGPPRLPFPPRCG